MGNNPCGWYPNTYRSSVLNTPSPSLTTSTLPNQATSEASIVLMIHCRYAGHSLQPAQQKHADDRVEASPHHVTVSCWHRAPLKRNAGSRCTGMSKTCPPRLACMLRRVDRSQRVIDDQAADPQRSRVLGGQQHEGDRHRGAERVHRRVQHENGQPDGVPGWPRGERHWRGAGKARADSLGHRRDDVLPLEGPDGSAQELHAHRKRLGDLAMAPSQSWHAPSAQSFMIPIPSRVHVLG